MTTCLRSPTELPATATVPAPPFPAGRVLVVADPRGAGAEMAAALRASGFEVTVETDGVAACAALQLQPVEGLVVDLDLGLAPTPGAGGAAGPDAGAGDGPGGEASTGGRPGLDVVHRARQADASLPVLVGAREGDVARRLHALELGADDYLARPLALEELVARLWVRVRRRQAEAASLLKAGRLELDLRSHAVRAAGAPVSLTGREFALLKLLVEARGRTVPRPVLQERLSEWGELPASNAVDVHVHRIRRKVGRENIHTFRGGYAVAA